MGQCSDEARVLLALGVFGVLLIWVGVAVAWTSALRVLRASRAALLEITALRRDALSGADVSRPAPAPTPRE